MLQQWKFILSNWINCYFKESGKQDQCVITESLLSIISHLRDYVNLDESKSSALDVHTIEEFICDKYPEFKFENGKLDASNEEEVYIAASLLLYFVCVNLKEVDMKSAMCSKLARDDQETILKFTKSLMECSAVTYRSVQAAIIESCGQDTASPAAETPPALRSLHCEVRRLRAALGAERFDRGYLQEELSRTTLRLDQLLKDKEQHKLEIMNLKAKISLCCGQESQPRGGVATGDFGARLARQLEESEQRLVDTQGKLDDVQLERDTYKAKIEELKRQRDNLLSAHQESSTLACQLSSDLETERRHSQALRELVSELRSHQQRNRLDCSQLECDDPDASAHSLHNASVCSEACAYVVEVQLGEERAKIVVLNEQLQALRDQLTELTQKTDTERLTFEKIISDNEDDIFNLKHRINEEIEEKSNLKSLYNDKLITLNNDINELEQRLKVSNENARVVIDQKIQEVQTLQDEKLSLLQSLSDETSKLENIIKNLRTGLDTEKNLKLKMKDDYENHMMKLNEKVLNRNNELVELQNNVFEKSEMIEQLHLDLRKEREATEGLANKYHSDIAQMNHDRRIVEQELQQKTDEAKELQKRLQQNVSVFEEFNKEIDDLKASVRMNSEKALEHENTAINEMREMLKQKEMQMHELQMETKRLEQIIHKNKVELSKQADILKATTEANDRDIQKLQLENRTLSNELYDVKVQLEVKVHSLKEKLTDNENLTDMMKKAYECQIENLNLMVTKISGYVKDKTVELEAMRKEKDRLQQTINDSCNVLKTLQNEVKSQKENQDKLSSDFESERLILKNMVTVTESVMEDQKTSLYTIINEHLKDKEVLQEENKALQRLIDAERQDTALKLQEKDAAFEIVFSDITELRNAKESLQKDVDMAKKSFIIEITVLKEDLENKVLYIQSLEAEKNDLADAVMKYKEDMAAFEKKDKELKIKQDSLNYELLTEIDNLTKALKCETIKSDCKYSLQEKLQTTHEIHDKVKVLADVIIDLAKENSDLEQDRNDYMNKLDIVKAESEEIELKAKEAEKSDNANLVKIVDENRTVIEKLEQIVQHELQQNRQLREDMTDEKLILESKCSLLQECQLKAEKEIETKVNELTVQREKNQTVKFNLAKYWTSVIEAYQSNAKELEGAYDALKLKLDECEKDLKDKGVVITRMLEEKVAITKELAEEKAAKEKYQCELKSKAATVYELRQQIEEVKKREADVLESLRKDNEEIMKAIAQREALIKTLQDEVKSQRENQDKLISDFESERLVLKNMVTVTESVIEDQKTSLHTIINEHLKDKEVLQEENKALQRLIDAKKQDTELKLQEKDAAFEIVFRDITELRNAKESLRKDVDMAKESFNIEITAMKEDFENNVLYIQSLEAEKNDLAGAVMKYKEDMAASEKKDKELKIKQDSLNYELLTEIDNLTKALKCETVKSDCKYSLQEKLQTTHEIHDKVKVLADVIIDLAKENSDLEQDRNDYMNKLDIVKAESEEIELKAKEAEKLKSDNANLVKIVDENRTVIEKLEQIVQHELQQNRQLREDMTDEKLILESKCSLLKECQLKAEKEIETKVNELTVQREKNQTVKFNLAKYWTSVIEAYQSNAKELEGAYDALKLKLDECEKDLKDKGDVITRMLEEKVAITKELAEEKAAKEKYQCELESKAATVYELRQQIEEVKKREADVLESLRKDNEEMMKAIAQREAFASLEKLSNHRHSHELHLRDSHQVSTPTSDLTHSSIESLKTISDLETIIHDRNRTITTLQTDITYLKSLMAESENKLLDVNKELEVSKENCQQLSVQLKKIVHQKNDEIAELKKQVNKMNVTETRASQIIKVSARYQAMILKRIAEIKSNTILKELTNFGNTTNCDNELRRSLNSGAITMEDLENFLETTDRHLKRCSEKQLALQKERDRLTEVNKINESEILNLKKFLTELSISFKTFSSVKDLYTQKLSKVVSIQRTVRREILSLDGAVTDATMCKLERSYAAMMQDLSECVMNLERWVERSIARTISPEKIKQAFSSDDDRTSLASTTFQNAGLEVQLEELENGFHKLLEQISRALKGEGAKDAQAVTVMEVRAEYEDKLNRMKAKMKQLYQEQIGVFKDKQREQIGILERELEVAKEELAAVSRGYEEHIRALTTELWSVGEKFLMKKDEAEWLRKKQRSGSLMSLQHVHSAGLAPPPEDPARPSDCHSLRSLPVTTNTNAHNTRQKQGRGLHMSDEEGEVFDNRWLKELSATPRRESLAPAPGQRLSELRWRNSLCPPHLKSSYPAETQFTVALDEDDIKCVAANGGKQQRKEVGITAYKKPGPPTPSKQAGRLSATDSELRESLRVEAEPQAARKTSTPSRIRALFRSARSDAVDGTPRTRRLSNIFRKK